MALLCLLLIAMVITASMTAPEVPLGLMHICGPITLTVQIGLIASCFKYANRLTSFIQPAQEQLLHKLRQQYDHSPDVMSLKPTYRTAVRIVKIAAWLEKGVSLAISEQTAKVVKWVIHLLRSWR